MNFVEVDHSFEDYCYWEVCLCVSLPHLWSIKVLDHVNTVDLEHFIPEAFFELLNWCLSVKIILSSSWIDVEDHLRLNLEISLLWISLLLFKQTNLADLWDFHFLIGYSNCLRILICCIKPMPIQCRWSLLQVGQFYSRYFKCSYFLSINSKVVEKVDGDFESSHIFNYD